MRGQGGYYRRQPEIKLPCTLINCNKCCINTEMPLSKTDVERLVRLGYRLEEFAVRDARGVLKLRNVNGRCFFLGERGCRVYEHRPIGCRLYPLVCVEGEGIAVDAFCPLAILAERIVVENPRLVYEASRVIEEEFGYKCPPRFLGVLRLNE